jgi:hypothetical protein
MTLGKEHGREEGVGPRAILDVWEEGQNLSPLLGFKPLFFLSVA